MPHQYTASVDAEGNTWLHREILACISPNLILDFIKSNPHETTHMLQTVNNLGKTPHDLIIAHTQLTIEQKNKLSLPILVLLANKEVMALSKEIKIDNLDHYESNSVLYKNLILACNVANQVRQILKRSCTHPEMNFTNANERNNVHTRVKGFRQRASDISVLELLCTTNPLRLLCDTTSVLIDKQLIPFISEGIGNCGEMAFTAYKLLRQSDRHIAAEVYGIINGDHLFLVIGINENAVICDPWSGNVYPFSELSNKLKAYRAIPVIENSKTLGATKSFINSTIEYNPHFFSVKPVKSARPVAPKGIQDSEIVIQASALLLIFSAMVGALLLGLNSYLFLIPQKSLEVASSPGL